MVVNQVSCTVLCSNMYFLKRCYARNDDDVLCGMMLDHRVCVMIRQSYRVSGLSERANKEGAN